MPELPEVETVKKTLNRWLNKRKIKKIEVFYENTLLNTNKFDFKTKLKDQNIHTINRKGKFLIFLLDDFALISHLRMEGKYFLLDEQKELSLEKYKHKKVAFYLDNNKILVYDDVRKFGKIKLVNINNYKMDKSLVSLGEEPKNIDHSSFYKKIKKSNRVIKQILLDQSIIAGLGNIYVDEVLFLSKINPLKKGSNITKKEANNIIGKSIEVLDKAIKLGGSTIKSFSYDNKADGKFQNSLHVYGKKDMPCPVCSNKIKKIKVSKRGTHFCPNCQK